MRPAILLALLTTATSCANEPTPKLVPPIAGLTISQLRDSFDEVRGQGKHEALDIVVARGTEVRAIVSGTIRKLFLSKPGGNTIYLFDEKEEFCYYYAHLESYRDGLHEGDKVKSGDLIGFVGTSGNANPNVPHLHMAIVELGPRKEWWKGTAVNPYPIMVQAVKNSINQK